MGNTAAFSFASAFPFMKADDKARFCILKGSPLGGTTSVRLIFFSNFLHPTILDGITSFFHEILECRKCSFFWLIGAISKLAGSTGTNWFIEPELSLRSV